VADPNHVASQVREKIKLGQGLVLTEHGGGGVLSGEREKRWAGASSSGGLLDGLDP